MSVIKLSEKASEAIAHIYAGLLKADGVISDEEAEERVLAKVLRYKSRNIMYLDGSEDERILVILKGLLSGDYSSWTSDKHSSYALSILKGEISSIDDIRPIRDTMKVLSKLDEITASEARYIKENMEAIENCNPT